MQKFTSWLRAGASAVALAGVLSVGSIAQAQDPIRLTVGGISGVEVEWMNNAVIPAFIEHRAAEGVTVEVEVLDSGNVSGEDQRQQYVLDLSVGEGADLMAFDGFWLPEFVDAGLLQPLPELVGENVLEWEGWTQIPEGLQQIMGYNGDVFGVPRGTDVRVIWYNRTLLTEAGYDGDNWQPASWEELLEAARAVKESNPEVTPLQLNAGTAMGEATTLQGYLMALLGTGEHVYDFDSNKWIINSQGILDTLSLYDVIYNQEGLGDARWQLVNNGRDLSFEGFANGEVAMLVEGDYLWRSILNEGGTFPMENRDENAGFALMPAQEPGKGWNGQDFVTISGGTGFIVNANSSNPGEAWELLSFMFSKEQVDALQVLQPRIRARLDVGVENDATMSALVEEGLPLTTIRPQMPIYNQVSALVQSATERVVAGELTPAEAAALYAEQVTALVGEEAVIDMGVTE